MCMRGRGYIEAFEICLIHIFAFILSQPLISASFAFLGDICFLLTL